MSLTISLLCLLLQVWLAPCRVAWPCQSRRWCHAYQRPLFLCAPPPHRSATRTNTLPSSEQTSLSPSLPGWGPQHYIHCFAALIGLVVLLWRSTEVEVHVCLSPRAVFGSEMFSFHACSVYVWWFWYLAHVYVYVFFSQFLLFLLYSVYALAMICQAHPPKDNLAAQIVNELPRHLPVWFTPVDLYSFKY